MERDDTMRCILLVVLSLAATACRSAPMKDPDLTTPEMTLHTFHDAFKHDLVDREYECFSYQFKKDHGNMDVKSYYEARRLFVDEHPMAAFFFSLGDLRDNIVELSGTEGDLATMKLSLGGEEIVIYFTQEAAYQLEFDKVRTERDDILEPFSDIVAARDRKLNVSLPLSKRTRENHRKLRRIVVEKRWKFLDFPFLDENIDISN